MGRAISPPYARASPVLSSKGGLGSTHLRRRLGALESHVGVAGVDIASDTTERRVKSGPMRHP